MRKIYTLENMTAGRYSTTFCGVKVNFEFKGGNPGAGLKARLETDNQFAQDAIEHDPRFGSDFKLWRTYGEEEKKEAAPAKAPKKVAKVKTVNDAITYFTELGETLTGDEDINALCEKHNVTFPNLK